MKRGLIFFVLAFMIVVISKYFFSNYNLEYKIQNHTVKTIYKDNRFYFEIDGKYNFDMYKKRSLNKMKISSIDEIKGDNFVCIYPQIKNVETVLLCIKDGMQIDHNLIEDKKIEKYKKSNNKQDDKKDDNFYYYKNLNEGSFVALWNYKGYIVMNKDNYENIELFKKDRYDNSLSYMKDNIIYMPDYDQEHEFNRLITLDITNNEKNSIDLEYTIDYDSYFVGSIKNNIYIFDNKHSVLYEINIKKKKTTIKANNETGYIKYENGEFVSCSKSEYKVDKISFDKDSSLYEIKFNNNLVKTMEDNKSIKTIIHNKDVSIISKYKNIVYYIDEDYLYRYDPFTGYDKILYFFELNFNKTNTVFVYNK